MMNGGKCRWLVPGVLAGLMATSCVSNEKRATVAQTRERVQTIDALYAEISGPHHHRRAVRKPVRDEHLRVRRELAHTADQLLNDTQEWDGVVCLTGRTEEPSDQLQEHVREFHAALRDLSGAEHADHAALQAAHQRMNQAYRQIEEATE